MVEVPKLSRENYVETMRSVFELTMRQVADAINDAPGGRMIAASEEKVRDLLGKAAENELPTSAIRHKGGSYGPRGR